MIYFTFLMQMERLHSQLKERQEKAMQADKSIAELKKQLEASNDKVGGIVLHSRLGSFATADFESCLAH